MAEPKTIEWVDSALLQLYEIASFINSEFGFIVANAFVTNAFLKTERLSLYPEIGRRSKKFKTVR